MVEGYILHATLRYGRDSNLPWQVSLDWGAYLMVGWNWSAPTLAVDPDSDARIARFLANGVKNPNLVLTNWAVATNTAKADSPAYAVPLTKQGGKTPTVRIPLGTKPDPSGDGHLVVRDPIAGVQADFWQAVYDSTTQRIKSASAGVVVPLGAVNEGTKGWGSNAANTRLDGGLVTAEEYKAWRDTGLLPTKTLQFCCPNIEGTTTSYRYPALHNAPTGTKSCGLSEGFMIALPATLDLSAYTGPSRFVGELLKANGAVCRDNGGSFGFYGRNPINGGLKWSSVGLSGASVPIKLPWDKLQVLVGPAA